MTDSLIVVLVAAGVLAVLQARDAVAGVAILARRNRPSYARLRRELRTRGASGFTADEVASLEERLARTDRVERRRRWIGIATRVLVLVLVLTAGGVVLVTSGGVPEPGVAIVVALIAVEIVAFVLSLAAAVVRGRRRTAVLTAQRIEVLDLLARARIPRAQHVPGLRDRVARALTILREKQR